MTNDNSLSQDTSLESKKKGRKPKKEKVYFGEKEELVFLGKEISEQRNYSEKIAERIDEEVDMIIKEAQKKAEIILDTNGKIKMSNSTQSIKAIIDELIDELIDFKTFGTPANHTTDPSTVVNLNLIKTKIGQLLY